MPPPSAAIAPEAAAARGAPLKSIRRRLRGDLDAIVCMHWNSIRASLCTRDLFADDLRALLETRPISLRRSHWSHAHTFVQRNWLACSLAAIAVLGRWRSAGVVIESERRDGARTCRGVSSFSSGSSSRPRSRPLKQHCVRCRPARDGARSCGRRRLASGARRATALHIANAQNDSTSSTPPSAITSVRRRRARPNDPLTVASAQLGHAMSCCAPAVMHRTSTRCSTPPCPCWGPSLRRAWNSRTGSSCARCASRACAASTTPSARSLPPSPCWTASLPAMCLRSTRAPTLA